MDLLNLLLSRRSIRRYTESPFLKGLWRPFWPQGSSPLQPGRRPWEFVVVQNPKRWKPLSHCRQGSAAMLSGAKPPFWSLPIRRKNRYVWTEDCAIAMSNMHLMAHHLGLGSC